MNPILSLSLTFDVHPLASDAWLYSYTLGNQDEILFLQRPALQFDDLSDGHLPALAGTGLNFGWQFTGIRSYTPLTQTVSFTSPAPPVSGNVLHYSYLGTTVECVPVPSCAVPEPDTMIFLALLCLGIALFRRR